MYNTISESYHNNKKIQTYENNQKQYNVNLHADFTFIPPS